LHPVLIRQKIGVRHVIRIPDGERRHAFDYQGLPDPVKSDHEKSQPPAGAAVGCRSGRWVPGASR
jgi:hypothetical protein